MSTNNYTPTNREIKNQIARHRFLHNLLKWSHEDTEDLNRSPIPMVEFKSVKSTLPEMTRTGNLPCRILPNFSRIHSNSSRTIKSKRKGGNVSNNTLIQKPEKDNIEKKLQTNIPDAYSFKNPK